MKTTRFIFGLSVRFLTLCCLVCFSACSLIDEHYAEPCNSHAYSKVILPDYISSRFIPGSPVRLGVIPFSVQENLAPNGPERPGIGNEIAWKLQANLLHSGDIPIVELFNRQDWPGKKEEFFTGNFGAISIAREAGFDLLLVGYLEPLTSLDSMTAYVKIIEAESGMTLYYGKTKVTTYQTELQHARGMLLLEDYRPPTVYGEILTTRLAQCIADSILNQELPDDL